MGTRSLTKFYEANGTEILVLYRQMDGYPEGHGTELAQFLAPMQICNGIGSGQSAGKWANGMGCLTAQVIAHFKQEIGGFYVHPAGTTDCGEDFTYVVKPNHNKITMEIYGGDGEVIFKGDPLAFLNQDKGELE